MSGHSKWSKIKRKKGAADAQRSNLYSKIIREIHAAARQGGADPDMNPRLRTVVDKAKTANMPHDTIKRALAKAADDDTTNYMEMIYEGYGPDGVAVLVESLTDNKNRTVADLRHLFSKNGGTLGEGGCVAWMFNRVGQAVVPFGGNREETELAIMDAGAEDIDEGEDGFEVTVAMEQLEAFRKQMDDAGHPVQDAELAYVATTTVDLDDAASGRVMKFLEAIEENDDVQAVWTNAGGS